MDQVSFLGLRALGYGALLKFQWIHNRPQIVTGCVVSTEISEPLTSMTPKWVARRAAGVGLGTADLPIGCSNLGDIDPAVNRPDGTDADYASGRLIEPGITKRALERVGGQLFVVTGRLHGRVWVSVNAYLLDRANSQDALREDVFGRWPNSVWPPRFRASVSP